MSRKLLSIIVAVVFVLSTMSTAFAAAVPSDVVGTDYTKAVTKMQGLGIMVGDTDGKFRPNDTIKRSEFAKIAVVAAGMGDAATISTGTTQFSDVPADHWAAGYINVAAGAGFIQGYAGKFNPDDAITYAQAVTIICRMLGYGPVLDSKPWPQTYFAKGAEIGVTKDVVAAPTVGAKRGDIAKLVNNALTINKLVVDTYDINGKPTYKVALDTENKTILAENLKCLQVTTGSGSTLTKKFRVSNTPAVRSDDATDKATFAGQDYTFVSALNPDDYLGLEIMAWYKNDDDKKIVAVEVQTAASDIYDGVISKDDNGKIKMDGLSKTSNLEDGAVYMVNGTGSATITNLTALTNLIGNNKLYGRVITDGAKVKAVYAWLAAGQNDMAADSGTNPYTSNTFVLREINSDGFFAGQKGFNGTANVDGYVDKIKVADLKSDSANKKYRLEVIKNGAAATLDDIKVGDVVTRIAFAGGAHYKYIVTSNEVKGTLSSVSGTGADMKLTVDGKEYTLTTKASMTFNNDAYDKNYTNIADVMGKEVSLKLNAAGQAVGLATAQGAKNYYYGIFKEGLGGANAYATIYKGDGTKVSYALENTDNMSGNWVTNTNKGSLVQYRLTSDGKIKDGSLTLVSGSLDNDNKVNGDLNYNFTNRDSSAYVATPSGSLISLTRRNTTTVDSVYMFNSSTVIYDVYDPSDVKVVSFDTIKDKTTSDIYMTTLRDGVTLKYVAIKALNANGTNALSANNKGVVVGSGYDADGQIIKINEEGTVKTYKLDGVQASAFNMSAYAEYAVNSDGKIKAVPSVVMSYNYNNGTIVATKYQGLYKLTGISGDAISVKPVQSVDDANSGVTVGNETALQIDGPKVYDASNTDDPKDTNIKGGKAMSDLKADDYIWVRIDPSSGKVTQIVKIKKGNITQSGS